MKKKHRGPLCIAMCLLAAFVFWTLALTRLDVQAIGPEGSRVGFATVNRFFHALTGVHMRIYAMTDWLGLVPVAFGAGFAMLGLGQLIKRRSLLKVDPSILALGGCYLLAMAAYVVFEIFVINYRPVLIEGNLEASYPSSTTMLVLCVMPTVIMQFHDRIKHDRLRKAIALAIWAFIAFMVLGRLVSGVHWLTDILGGALLSAGLVMLYAAICRWIASKETA